MGYISNQTGTCITNTRGIKNAILMNGSYWYLIGFYR